MDIEDLIYKFVLNELTPEEEIALKQIIEKDVKYKDLLESLQDRSYLKSRYQMYKRMDVEKAWKKNVRFRHPGNKRIYLLRYAVSVACVVAVALISYLVLHVGKDEKSQPTLVAHSRIPVATSTADVQVVIEGNSYIVKDSADLKRYQQELLVPTDSVAEVKKLQIVVNAGHTFNFTLPDGSIVRMNSGSKLEYPSKFTGNTREVVLSGEAYFDVQQDARHPFIIACSDYKVQVLGTSFNVKDYAEDSQSYITLVQGKVRVMSETSDCMLDPSQQAVMNKSNGALSVRDVNPNEYLSWLKGRFHFKEASLTDVAHELSRWYGVRFVIENHTNKTFTGGFAKYEDVNKILKLLSETTQIDFMIQDSCVIVK